MKKIRKWWRHFKRRMSYKNEAEALWREIALHRLNQGLLENLIREKQAKIHRLQAAYGITDAILKPDDMKPETIFKSLEDWTRQYAEDFEARQKQWQHMPDDARFADQEM